MNLRRGDVMRLSVGRIGFGRNPSGAPLVVVLQADAANALLGSVVVAPVEARFDPDALLPFAVIVERAEIDASRDHVAHVHLLRAIPIDAISTDRVGTIRPATWSIIRRALLLLLG